MDATGTLQSPTHATPGRPAPPTVLLVEDDEDDYVLTRDALAAQLPQGDLRWVRDGEEALDYLLRRGAYENGAPRPALILLDLNMPRVGGLEVAQALRNHPQWRATPIVVFTTSEAEADVQSCYQVGVNSFIQKPLDYRTFNAVIRNLTDYWFGTVKLPG